jgi:hypothetical protein
MSRRAAALLLTLALGGCAAQGNYPTDLNTRTRLGFAPSAEQVEVERLLATDLQLPAAPRAALVVMHGPDELALDDRAALVETLQRDLKRAPFSSVRTLSPLLAEPATADGTLSLDALRTAAARSQSDVLVVVSTGIDTARGTNLLSLAYLAVVPVAFVPGSEVGAWASAEACAIAVRSGLFLGCASGHGRAREGFVLMAGTADAERRVARTAVDGAVGSLPDRIAELVADDVASAAPALRGIRYATPGDGAPPAAR